MTPPAQDDPTLDAFAQALVSEIKAEMGRRDLSSRGLAAKLGENPQYVTSRLGAGNPRTGKRVAITVTDMYAIARVLGLDPVVLMRTALEAAEKAPSADVARPQFGAGRKRDEMMQVQDEAAWDEEHDD